MAQAVPSAMPRRRKREVDARMAVMKKVRSDLDGPAELWRQLVSPAVPVQATLDEWLAPRKVLDHVVQAPCDMPGNFDEGVVAALA
eukprot:2484690-Lingulodinium_polyedra.AAC.1